MAGKLSPMMSYYLSLKEEYKEEIVLFRLGDFYEMFFDDAVRASNILGLTLTGRDCGLSERAPMCGVPYHAVDNYIAKLIANGEKVAVCEQLSDPKESKGMVERGVVRVITPGTIIEDNILDERSSNYIAAVYANNSKVGVAWADMSTGEFNVSGVNTSAQAIEDILTSIMPAELLAEEQIKELLDSAPSVRLGKLPKPYVYKSSAFAYDAASKTLLKQFGVSSLKIYECDGEKHLVGAAGALMAYLLDTQKRSLAHIGGLKVVTSSNYMLLDANTRRNLEITANNRDNKRYGSILWVVDKTCTNMGTRLIKNWLDRPLVNEKQINARLDAVEELVDNNPLRTGITDILKGIRDLERLACKVAYNNATPRDLLAICDTLEILPNLKEILGYAETAYLKKANANIDPEEEICKLLRLSISEECPALIKDGGYIKQGFNEELDNVRNAKNIGHGWLADIEKQEREATGIKQLKVGFNRVFGFYIEVPKSSAKNVPYRYVRKQTLANSERFTTEELKEIENNVLNAEERALALEAEIFAEIKKTVLARVQAMQITANAIAAVDALQSFAEVSRLSGYVKPVINGNIKEINIVNGRHPVVEKLIGRNYFTANNTFLDNGDNRTMIITGPNMAGKSTYMRQVAAIALLAHVGCFVPADSAEISLVDRIFTRVGASDDLAYGQSTFMVEMIEVATILKNATNSSLLILDEIGRGTSTCDGLSIAWAVMEYISNNFKTKTLFSTHYHELTALEGVMSGVKNFKINVTELGEEVIFTHKISRGGANRSFGIEVARLAGLPLEVIKRAGDICAKLEKETALKDANAIVLGGIGKVDENNSKQISFLSNSISDEVCDKLNKLDVNNLTPMQALVELENLKELAKRSKK